MRRRVAASALAALILPGATGLTLGDEGILESRTEGRTEQSLMRKEIGAEATPSYNGAWWSHSVEETEKVAPTVDLASQLAAERDRTSGLAKQMEELKGLLQQALLTRKDVASAPPGWSDAPPPQPQAPPPLPAPPPPSWSQDKKQIPNPSTKRQAAEERLKAEHTAATLAMEKEQEDMDKTNDKIASQVQWLPGKAREAALAPVGPAAPSVEDRLGSNFASSGAETSCASELANFGCRCFARDPGWDACDMYPCVDCTTKLNAADMNLLPENILFLKLPGNGVEDFQPEVLDHLPKLHGMQVADGIKVMGLNDRLPAQKPTKQEFAALLQSMSVKPDENKQ